VGEYKRHQVSRFGAFHPEVDRRGREVEPTGRDDLQELEGEQVMADARVVAIDGRSFGRGIASRVEEGAREPGEAEPRSRMEIGLQGGEAACRGGEEQVFVGVAPGAALVVEAHL